MITCDKFEIIRSENINEVNEYHFHIHFEILYFQSGSAKIFSDGYEVSVSAGNCLVIPPFCPHKSIYSNCAVMKILFPLSYIDKYLTEETTQTLRTHYSTRISINNRPISNTIMSLTDDIENANSHGAFLYIYKLLVNCITIPETCQNTDKITDIITYIGSHAYGKIMLDEVADACNVTKYHICRLFKSKLGISPVEYITFARIRRSVAKLMYTENTISVISKELGFYSPNYFSTLFKSYFKMLPSKLRKNIDCVSDKRYYLSQNKCRKTPS